MRIAVLGVGIMGSGIIRNLQKNGYPLNIYNRTSEKAIQIASQEDKVCYTPFEAAKNAEVIISVVENDVASKEIWFGENGVIKGITKTPICIEMSTLSIEYINYWIKEIKRNGCIPIDSPATGSKKGAEEGTLTLFLGCSEDIYEKVKYILYSFSQNHYIIGPPSFGMKFKLAYNSLGGMILVALAESISLAQNYGLNLNDFLDVLVTDNGWGKAVAIGKGKNMVHSEYDNITFSIRNLEKDIRYALNSSDNNNIYSLLNSTRYVLESLLENGNGSLDMSAVRKAYLKKEDKQE